MRRISYWNRTFSLLPGFILSTASRSYWTPRPPCRQWRRFTSCSNRKSNYCVISKRCLRRRNICRRDQTPSWSDKGISTVWTTVCCLLSNGPYESIFISDPLWSYNAWCACVCLSCLSMKCITFGTAWYLRLILDSVNFCPIHRKRWWCCF